MEQADWHYIAEERFAGAIADALYRLAHGNRFDKLVVVAPAKVLGNLRQAFHAEVTERIVGEIPKELTSHPIPEIERLMAASKA
jgi:protein required for attachment to host cells